ncbi:MAG: DNA-directed RNA polymerase subunit omega [Ignavibacteriae bacterium]|nr:DNA-directed RNA polymerase subunit omega [Ignavibacteriota bacterium]
MAVQPVDMEKFYSNIGDVYEAIVITAKRARQIHSEVKIELNQRLETIQQLTSMTETEEELNGTVNMNPDQLKISLEFETRPKSTELALNEVMDQKVQFRYKESEQKPTAGTEADSE